MKHFAQTTTLSDNITQKNYYNINNSLAVTSMSHEALLQEYLHSVAVVTDLLRLGATHGQNNVSLLAHTSKSAKMSLTHAPPVA